MNAAMHQEVSHSDGMEIMPITQGIYRSHGIPHLTLCGYFTGILGAGWGMELTGRNEMGPLLCGLASISHNEFETLPAWRNFMTTARP